MSEIVCIVSACALPLIGCVLAGLGYNQEKAMTEWFYKLKQPSFAPPNWIYPVVWTYLYPSTGFASYLVWRSGGGFFGEARVALLLYAISLVVSWSFSPLYFGRRDLWAGFTIFVGMTLSVLTCGLAFYRINHSAGLLFIPYVLWCIYATYLTHGCWKLNREKKAGKDL